ANRIYVQTAVYDTFAAKLATTVAELELGSGFAPGVTMGPLIDEAAVIKVEEHVADAVSKGAVVLAGGKRSPIGNLFYEPTILTGVTSSMR
ncbi:aldehyde dehydrogenase family protein, partial [Escherichia coli]